MGKDELIVIVPAAGAGKRLGLGINKAFAMLNGAPLLVHCLHMLEATGLVKRAVVVLAPQEVVEGRELLAGYQKDYFRTLPFCVVAGGKERQDSVANALAAVEETDCYIAVHDGAGALWGPGGFLFFGPCGGGVSPPPASPALFVAERYDILWKTGDSCRKMLSSTRTA